MPEKIGEAEVTSLCYNTNSALFTGTNSGLVCVWDCNPRRCFMTWEADEGEIGEYLFVYYVFILMFSLSVHICTVFFRMNVCFVCVHISVCRCITVSWEQGCDREQQQEAEIVVHSRSPKTQTFKQRDDCPTRPVKS